MDMLEAFVIMQCINMLHGLIPSKVRLQTQKNDEKPSEKKLLDSCYQCLDPFSFHRSRVASYLESTWSVSTSSP